MIVELQSSYRELEADRKTLQRQHDSILRDAERVQATCAELTAARTIAEQTSLKLTADVTKLSYLNARLEQEVDNKEKVFLLILFISISLLAL